MLSIVFCTARFRFDVQYKAVDAHDTDRPAVRNRRRPVGPRPPGAAAHADDALRRELADGGPELADEALAADRRAGEPSAHERREAGEHERRAEPENAHDPHDRNVHAVATQ